jgi:hypothetical protein
MVTEELERIGLHLLTETRRIAYFRAFATRCARLRHAFCGLFGCEMLRHFERERLSLRCVQCGYETPGWTLAIARPDPVAPRRSRAPR